VLLLTLECALPTWPHLMCCAGAGHSDWRGAVWLGSSRHDQVRFDFALPAAATVAWARAYVAAPGCHVFQVRCTFAVTMYMSRATNRASVVALSCHARICSTTLPRTRAVLSVIKLSSPRPLSLMHTY